MLVKNYEYDEPAYEEEIDQERRDELISFLQSEIRAKDGTIPLHVILYYGKDSNEYLFMYNWLTENGIKIIGRNGTISEEKYNFQELIWLNRSELPEVLTREEEHELFGKMNTTENPEEKRAIRKEIIEKNIRLANWVVDCKITTDLKMPKSEIYSYVYECLIESVDRFNYQRTYTLPSGEEQYYKFSSYAVPRMIFDLLRKRELYQSYMGVEQMSISTIRELQQLQTILDEFSLRGVKPTIENLEEILSKPKDTIIRLLNTKSKMEKSRSFDEIMEESIDNTSEEMTGGSNSRLQHIEDTDFVRNMHDADTLNISTEGRYIVDGVYVDDENNGPFKDENMEQIMDYNEDVEKLALKKQLKSTIASVLDTLTDREAKVLTLRLGLDDGKERTLEQVGEIFGLTRERVRQIEAKAFRKLRHPSRMKKIAAYIGNADTSSRGYHFEPDYLGIQDSQNFYITQKGRTDIEGKEDDFLYAQDFEESRKQREKDMKLQNNITEQLENMRVKKGQKVSINEKQDNIAEPKNSFVQKSVDEQEDVVEPQNTAVQNIETEQNDLIRPKQKVVNQYKLKSERETIDSNGDTLQESITSLKKAYLEYSDCKEKLSERKENIMHEIQKAISTSEDIKQKLKKAQDILTVLEITEAVETLKKKMQKYEKMLLESKKKEQSLNKELEEINKEEQSIEDKIAKVKEGVNTLIVSLGTSILDTNLSQEEQPLDR